MDRRSLLKTAALAGVAGTAALTLPSGRASAQTMKWKVANLYPRGSIFEADYEGFNQRVKVMSGGRLEITSHYDGEGVTATEVYAAAKSGLFEIGAPYMALHAGELPEGVIELGLPGGPLRYIDLLALFYAGGWMEELRKTYAEQGLFYLAPYFQMTGVYLITKEPINSLDDLKGKVLRAPGSYGKFMRSMGVEPVVMAFAEMYPAMATGVIDGAASSNLIDYRDIQLVEIAKYVYPVPVTGSQVANFIVNMDAWNKLSDDLKTILEVAAVWHGQAQAITSTINEKLAVAEMVAKGLKWNPPPSEADAARWKAAGDSLWGEYEAQGPHSKELIRLLRESMKKMGI
jgi:TRAP-type mannitol/chloroaromatic compound transport system substrate-binding protein